MRHALATMRSILYNCSIKMCMNFNLKWTCLSCLCDPSCFAVAPVCKKVSEIKINTVHRFFFSWMITGSTHLNGYNLKTRKVKAWTIGITESECPICTWKNAWKQRANHYRISHMKFKPTSMAVSSYIFFLLSKSLKKLSVEFWCIFICFQSSNWPFLIVKPPWTLTKNWRNKILS